MSVFTRSVGRLVGPWIYLDTVTKWMFLCGFNADALATHQDWSKEPKAPKEYSNKEQREWGTIPHMQKWGTIPHMREWGTIPHM